jgi:UDP-glucose 4-epimerase
MGGMLGSHVHRAVVAAGERVWQPTEPVPWRDPGAAAVLVDHASQFLAAGQGRPWVVYWCAGAGVTATAASQLQAEVDLLACLLAAIDPPAAQLGVVFLASSVGGLYAGSGVPPFDEGTAPRPLSPYGRSKQAMEEVVGDWAARAGGRSLVGRISNLYGPGQDLDKPQGLITQLIRSHLERRPLQVYVSLDTTRDYLFVRDAAQRVVAATHRAASLAPGSRMTKVVASQRATTVGAVIGELHRVLRRRPPIILGSSPVSGFQARDLRVRSTVWPDLDTASLTPLPVGMHETLLELQEKLQAGRLGPSA